MLGSSFFGLRCGFRTLFYVGDAVVKNLPGDSTEAMGHRPDRPFVAQFGQQPAKYILEMAVFRPHRRVRRLIE